MIFSLKFLPETSSMARRIFPPNAAGFFSGRFLSPGRCRGFCRGFQVFPDRPLGTQNGVGFPIDSPVLVRPEAKTAVHFQPDGLAV
jgi:hypothetical protein